MNMFVYHLLAIITLLAMNWHGDKDARLGLMVYLCTNMILSAL